MVQDIKPNNILLNFDTSGMRVVEAKLADCGKLKQFRAFIILSRRLQDPIGDACNVDLKNEPHNTPHAIGAAIFRSPEALLGLNWSTPTDIWSFGATASHSPSRTVPRI